MARWEEKIEWQERWNDKCVRHFFEISFQFYGNASRECYRVGIPVLRRNTTKIMVGGKWMMVRAGHKGLMKVTSMIKGEDEENDPKALLEKCETMLLLKLMW